MLRRRITVLLVFGPVCVCMADDGPTKESAADALHRAVEFFRTEASAHGGYLWRYSADLERREGEGKASASTAWVQPPGTPTAGFALLDVYELAGGPYYLDAARETAHALVLGQLRSGGWNYRIEFDPEKRAKYAYRAEPAGGGTAFNITTLDDNTTQAALRFLMRIDKTLEFKDEKIHETAQYALNHLLEAQYPNGAWPQRFNKPPDPKRYPVKKAAYPERWSRTHQRRIYEHDYTFNDNAISDMIDTMFDAAEVYNDERCRAAAEKAGDFILLAQMPEPQPAWAQQYDENMCPSWARKFEPPAVTGGESQGVMRTLIDLYRRTGKTKYLDPLPRALEYFKGSRLPDGRLARFYELKTNNPLYFTKDYKLTYDNSDMPTHYAFIVGSRLDGIEAEYKRVKEAPPGTFPANAGRQLGRKKPAMTGELKAKTAAIIAALDARGAWVESGRLRYQGEGDTTTKIITTTTFANNIRTLAHFLAAAHGL